LSNLKRIAPLFSIVGALFFFYGYYILMFRENILESMMFIVAYLLFIYVSVTIDDDWILLRDQS
jgi:hypothetical protein